MYNYETIHHCHPKWLMPWLILSIIGPLHGVELCVLWPIFSNHPVHDLHGEHFFNHLFPIYLTSTVVLLFGDLIGMIAFSSSLKWGKYPHFCVLTNNSNFKSLKACFYVFTTWNFEFMVPCASETHMYNESDEG